jgi:hypothetical protein
MSTIVVPRSITLLPLLKFDTRTSPAWSFPPGLPDTKVTPYGLRSPFDAGTVDTGTGSSGAQKADLTIVTSASATSAALRGIDFLFIFGSSLCVLPAMH